MRALRHCGSARKLKNEFHYKKKSTHRHVVYRINHAWLYILQTTGS